MTDRRLFREVRPGLTALDMTYDGDGNILPPSPRYVEGRYNRRNQWYSTQNGVEYHWVLRMMSSTAGGPAVMTVPDYCTATVAPTSNVFVSTLSPVSVTLKAPVPVMVLPATCTVATPSRFVTTIYPS